MWLSSRNARISAEPHRLRVFKGESAVALLRLDSGRRRWVRTGALSLGEFPGLTSECRVLDPMRFEMLLRPVCAGKFELRTVSLEVTDVTGLFVSQETLPIEVVVESLPLSLLEPKRVAATSLLAVGENPSGRRGSGQELYAVGPYRPDVDTKDILWRRVARMEDESIPVRVREANIRMSVRIGVALSWTSSKQRAERVDLVLEAVAQMGSLLLSLGTAVEVVFALGPSLERKTASNEVELVDSLMALSETSSSAQSTLGSANCDLLVLGPEQLDGLRSRVMGYSPPVVVVSEEVPASILPPGVAAFTGREDLSALSMLVLNR
jgi:uncharacterized protein (DUF58 family)